MSYSREKREHEEKIRNRDKILFSQALTFEKIDVDELEKRARFAKFIDSVDFNHGNMITTDPELAVEFGVKLEEPQVTYPDGVTRNLTETEKQNLKLKTRKSNLTVEDLRTPSDSETQKLENQNSKLKTQKLSILDRIKLKLG